MVVAVSAPVLNEPVAPDPPVPELEVHEVLLVDDQVMEVLAPFAIEGAAAEMDTVGVVTGGMSVAEPPPPEHAARPETANSSVNKTPGGTLDLTGLLFDMIVSLS